MAGTKDRHGTVQRGGTRVLVCSKLLPVQAGRSLFVAGLRLQKTSESEDRLKLSFAVRAKLLFSFPVLVLITLETYYALLPSGGLLWTRGVPNFYIVD